jgi:hypothetical protein
MSCIFYFGEGLNLIDGELFQFGTKFKFLYFDNFDSNSLIGFLIETFINFSKLALPDHIVQHVVFYLFAHNKSVKLIIIMLK